MKIVPGKLKEQQIAGSREIDSHRHAWKDLFHSGDFITEINMLVT